MGRLILIIGIIVFCLLLLIDLYGHRKRRVQRKALDRFFLCFIIGGIAIMGVILYLGSSDNVTDKTPGQYLAYNYLLDGDASHARDAALQDDSMSEREKTLINLFALALEKDYKNLYYESKEFTGSADATTAQSDYAESLYELAMNAINDGKNITSSVKSLLKQRYEECITDTSALGAYYELDSRIKNNGAEAASDSEIETLLSNFPGESTSMKLAIRYYSEKGNYDAALAQCEQLLDSFNSVSNTVILTDMLAQDSYISSASDFAESTDREIKNLVDKASAALDKSGTATKDSKVEKQLENAYEYIDAASVVVAKRIINFTNVKYDPYGLYDLAKIKAEITEGEFDTALSDFNNLLDNASLLSSDSQIRDALLNIRNAKKDYFESGCTKDAENVLADCINELIRCHGENVIPIESDSVNSRASDILLSLIVNDCEEMNITSITNEAAKVCVKFNMNIARANVIGADGEFYADEITVVDNDVDVTNFDMSASIGTGDRSLSIVYAVSDTSAADDIGAALRKLRSDSAAKKYALTDTSMEVVSAFSDSEEHFLLATRSLSETGDKRTASLYEMLCSAIAELNENNMPDKTLLCITDSGELNEEQLSSIMQTAEESSIAVYSIVLDGGDEYSMASLAEATGGAYRLIEEPVQVFAAAEALVKLMNNQYTITFKPDSELGQVHRIVVSMPEKDLSAEKEAAINENN